MALRTRRAVYLLDYQFIIKGCNWGTAGEGSPPALHAAAFLVCLHMGDVEGRERDLYYP